MGEPLLFTQIIGARFKVGTELAEFEVESLRAARGTTKGLDLTFSLSV